MAFFDAATSQSFDIQSLWCRDTALWSRLTTTPFERRSAAIAQRVADLRALSDTELLARGLTRDGILHHVFSQKQL